MKNGFFLATLCVALLLPTHRVVASTPDSEPPPTPLTVENPLLDASRTGASVAPVLDKGYAGYFDLGVEATMRGESAFSFSTSHGYRFNPYLFAGGGIALSAHADGSFFTPLYAVGRFALPHYPIIPFADVRVGISPGLKDGSHWAFGAYFSPSVGLSFPVGTAFAVQVGAAYTLQSQSTDYSYDDGYKRYFGTRVTLHHALSLRVGLAF